MKLLSQGIAQFVSETNKLLAISFLLISIFGLPAFAQEATIVGTVTDSSGAVVPNATITITNIATGRVRKMQATMLANTSLRRFRSATTT